MYGTLAGFRAYALERGDSSPTAATDPVATAALVRGSDYIRAHYVLRYGLDEASAEVIEAAYIAAGIELATPGFWSVTYTPASAKVLTGVKGITWTLVGGKVGFDSYVPTSSLIDALLGPFMGRGGLVLMVV